MMAVHIELTHDSHIKFTEHTSVFFITLYNVYVTWFSKVEITYQAFLYYITLFLVQCMLTLLT